MSATPRLLVVADAADELPRIAHALAVLGKPLELERVERRDAFLRALADRPWAAVLADEEARGLDAATALRAVRASRLDAPFVVLAAGPDEERAAAALRAGANDVVSKRDLGRLSAVLERELRGAAERRARRAAEYELQARERRFGALLDATSDALFTVDLQQRHTGAWGRWLEQEGLATSAVVGRKVADVFGAQAGPVHQAAMARALAGEQVVYESSRPGAVGLRHFQTTLTPSRDRRGAVIGLVGLRRETTEAQQLKAQLLAADRMTAVGILAAGVGHEINNPLTAVVVGVQCALERVASAPAEAGADCVAALEDALQAANAIGQIVKDLRLFSRPPEDERGPADVNRAVESALRMAKNQIRHRARLVTRLAPTPLVAGSEARLGQVFLNLVLNAAQAICEGDVAHNELRVSTGVDEEGRVVVAISDTGEGILPEHLGRIFEPFFTTKPNDEGTGLGLFICQRIVTELGGELSVHSEPGKGAEFRVRLRPAEAAPASRAVTDAPRSGGRRGRVLVVDDEETIGAGLRRLLEAEHEVVAHTSAEAALTCLREGAQFDLILCDLMMPQVTGMEFHSQLALTAPQQAQQVVFFTGGAFTPRARAFLQGVPNPLLEKPVDTAQLRSLIGQRLR